MQWILCAELVLIVRTHCGLHAVSAAALQVLLVLRVALLALS
jgi:hypothetical protein